MELLAFGLFAVFGVLVLLALIALLGRMNDDMPPMAREDDHDHGSYDCDDCYSYDSLGAQ